ncbi:hypothetical protein Tco_1308904 [Tanacetum coccineum]
MKNRVSTLSDSDLKDLIKTFRIPLDLYPHFPDSTFTMDRLPSDAIGVYSEFFWFSSVHIPFLTFLLFVLKYCKVHISQLVPLGLNKVVSFEVLCRDLNIVPTVTLFRVFQCLCKQGGWFSFSKHRNMEDICMDDGPSSLKKWKNKFFLIDRRAIPDHLTWRHSHSCVSDDLPADGYDRNDVEQLHVHLIRLREMKEELLVRSGLSSVWSNKECDPVFRRNDDTSAFMIFMTLPSWGDAKILEEPHHLSKPLLERVPSHITALVAEDALILLPTPDEVAAAQLDPRLARKAKGPSQVRVRVALVIAPEPSQPFKNRRLKKRALEAGSSTPELGQAEGLNKPDITDLCAELEDNMERDNGTSIRTASVPRLCLGKRLGPSPSMAVASVSGRPLVRTSAHASTSGHNLALRGSVTDGFTRKSRAEAMRRQMDPLDALARIALSRDVEYDEIPEDNFGTATRGEEIELTLFPLAPGPYQMSYPYEDRTITPAELKRIESLLLLELSNCVNVLSTLLVSHGMELNSRYTDLVASRVRLQEKLDRKTGYVKVLRSEVTSLDKKLEKVQRDCDALGQENR